MNSYVKISGINLLILIGYTIILHLTVEDPSGYDGLAIMVGLMFFIGAHVATNMIIMIVQFVKGNKMLGSAYLLSAGLVLVIGFSTCWAGAM